MGPWDNGRRKDTRAAQLAIKRDVDKFAFSMARFGAEAAFNFSLTRRQFDRNDFAAARGDLDEKIVDEALGHGILRIESENEAGEAVSVRTPEHGEPNLFT